MKKLPLVSCLCVTKNALNLLRRSIDCFRAQTYPNKELIIVKQGEDQEILAYLDKLKDTNILLKTVPLVPHVQLGDLRNISIEASTGAYFCVWDDDDWQHIDRLTMQVTSTLRSFHPASALTNLLVYDGINQKTYFSPYRLWEGTLLCKKELFRQGLKYPSLPKGEDTGFLDILLRYSKIYPIVSSTTYVYIFHGDNTWNHEHFKKFVFLQPLSEEASKFTTRLLLKNVDPVKASRLLDGSMIPREINYFYSHRRIQTDTKIIQ